MSPVLPTSAARRPVLPLGENGGTRSVRAAAILVGLGVLAALLLVVPGTIDVLDGQSMVQVTRSIVEHGDTTVTGPVYGVRGLDGRWYSKYGPGQSLAAIPLYLAGRALAPVLPAPYRPEIPIMAASLLPAIATGVTAALVMLAAVELGASALGGLGLAVVYAFTTPAAVYATQWFSEALTACAILTAVYLLVRDRVRPTAWRPLLAGAALGLAVATRIETLLLAPPLLLYATTRPGRRVERAASLLLPLVVVLAGLGLYNAARFGSPWQTGYSEGDRFAIRDIHPARTMASFAEGLYGLLISPGKGLVEYAPAALLAPFGAVALWTRRQAETALLLALIAVDLVAHANVLIRWLGGWSWGPRFLVPVLPLIVLLLSPLLARGRPGGRGAVWALWMLALVGMAVQLPALAVQEPYTYIASLQPRYGALGPTPSIGAIDRLERAYVNQPDLSPIVGSWRMLGDTATWTPPRGATPEQVARKSVTFAPHTWWRMLSVQGAPSARLVAACVLLATAAAACLFAALWVSAEADRDQRPRTIDVRV